VTKKVTAMLTGMQDRYTTFCHF